MDLEQLSQASAELSIAAGHLMDVQRAGDAHPDTLREKRTAFTDSLSNMRAVLESVPATDVLRRHLAFTDGPANAGEVQKLRQMAQLPR